MARPRLWADIGTAVALFVLFGLPTALSGLPTAALVGSGTAGIFGAVSAAANPIVLVAAVGMPVASVWRASHPVGAAVAVYVLALAHFAVTPAVLPIDLVVFLALYSVTVHGPRWAERTALAGALAGAVLAVLATVGGAYRSAHLVEVFFALGVGAALVILAWGAGLLRRSQAVRRANLKEQAEQLERERDQQAGLAAAAERTRIAREMHDVVAHSLTIMIAQADGGRYAAAVDHVAAERALETIAETGRAALADTRRILGIFRDDDAAQILTPPPSGDWLASLFEHIREAGVPVSHVEVGTAVGLRPGTSAALYRIVQESLTNVLKHGGPGARATVMIEWKPGTAHVVISDNGRGAASISDGGGHGLVGMRERAIMLGGSLTAGPGPGGGFRVEAHIPTDPIGVEP